MELRPWSDWILLELDPPQKKSELITTVNDGNSGVRTGVVRRAGPGKPRENGIIEPMEVNKGDHVAFIRWHQEHRPGKKICEALYEMSQEHGKDFMLIRQNDVLFVFSGDVKVDVGG